jgi:Dolichyl-phosphate-mannose-protein mannosyltransferase
VVRSFWRRPAPWALLAGALAARIGMQVATSGYTPLHDDHDYDRLGWSIAQGKGYPLASTLLPDGRLEHHPLAYRPPGFPYLLAGVYSVFGHDLVAARVVQAVLGTVAVGLIGALAHRLWGPRVALAAMTLAGLDMTLILTGSSLVSEPLFIVCELGALLAAVRARERPGGWGWVLLTGVLAGLGALTRTNGPVLLIPLVLLLLPRGRPRFGEWARPAAVLGLTALTVAPWTIRNATHVHAFVPISTETGNTLAGTYNAVSRADPVAPGSWRLLSATPYAPLAGRGLTGPQLDRELRSRVVDFIADHPLYPFQVVRWNLPRLTDLSGLRHARFNARTIDVGAGWADAGAIEFWVVGALALAGIALGTGVGAPRALWLAPALLALVALLVNAETPRFRAPIEPFVVLLAAPVALALTRRSEWHRRLRAF